MRIEPDRSPVKLIRFRTIQRVHCTRNPEFFHHLYRRGEESAEQYLDDPQLKELSDKNIQGCFRKSQSD